MTQKNDLLSRFPAFYGYTINSKLVVLQKNFKVSKTIVKTLADMLGKDLYLYSINQDMEIYHVRRIVCVQNKCKEVQK